MPPGKKFSNASREYLSVKLDDPTFAAPRFFTCVVAAGDEVRAISGPSVRMRVPAEPRLS
jgi:uncharacterized protein (DUF736 family)